MKREEVTVCEKEREEDKKRNKQRTQMKTSAENTTERPPERPPSDPPNPWFMSCQAQDTGPSLTTTWSAELPAPPHPFFIPNHEIKKTNVPPIQKRYVEEWPKGRFPCKQAASKQQASQPASQPASKQAASSSKQQQTAATASSRQAAAGNQQQASSSTTLRNWYDLNRALVWSSKNRTEMNGFDPQKPLKRFNKSMQIS